jgi:hypothetical protein
MSEAIPPAADSALEIHLRDELATGGKQEKKRRYERFTLAAMSSIPWVGGFLSASASASAEADQAKVNEVYRRWLEEHARKLQLLGKALSEMTLRIEGFGPEGQGRLDSEDYLSLIRQGFRTWDESATDEKRALVQALLTNAAGTTLCSDDVVRLFLDWIDRYHEIHFAVIREIYKNPGITRLGIWMNIYGRPERDDSAEADLYRLLIHDLSTGRVIRQHRPVNVHGQFLKKTKSSSAPASPVMKSAFDNTEGYELSELGKQFVHYTMSEIVPRIGSPTGESGEQS